MPSIRTTVTLDFNRHLLLRFAWDRFRDRLAAVHTADDALALLADTPPDTAPSRPHFDRLADFLRTLAPPAGATPDELAVFADVTERLVASGSVQPGAGAGCLVALAHAQEALITNLGGAARA